MLSYFTTGFGTYYVLCSAFILIKVGPWTKRPTPISLREEEVEELMDNDDGKDYKTFNNEEDNNAIAPSSTLPKPKLKKEISIYKRLGPSRGQEENPFYSHSWRLTESDRLKMAALGPILIPIRLAGVITTSLLACLLSSIAVAGLPQKNFECGSTKPLSWWRCLFRLPILFLGRCMVFSMGYMYIEEEGKAAPLKDAPIVISNHMGPIEPFILAIRTGGMAVSRLENASMPLFGSLCKAFLPIFVNRNDPDSRTAVKNEIESRAREVSAGKYNGPVFLFPEGTTTNGSSVITFKAGAFQPRLPIQPAVITFPHKPGQIYPSWTVVGPDLPELFFRMLCEPYNRCKIKWLPPVKPLEPEEMSEWPGPKLYATRVQGIVANALGSKTTQFAFEDVQLMQEACKFDDKYLTLTTGAAVEFKKLQSELVDVTMEDAKRYLDTFHKLGKTVNGELTFEEFRDAYADRKIPSEYLQNMFDLLDNDCSGRMSFREFLIGACLVNSSSDQMLNDALKFSFQIFDLKSEGRIDLKSAQRILRVVYPGTSEDGLKKVFDKIDTNGDGCVDQAEFIAFVKEHEEALPRLQKLLVV